MYKFITLFILVFILQTYSQTCFGISSSNTSVCSSSGACLSTDTCSCYSGYSGFQCGSIASASCTWNNNSQTSIGFYPILDLTKIRFINNNFQFSVELPIVNQRLNSTVYIQSTNYTQCLYPGNYSMNVLDLNSPCYNRINYSIPWTSAIGCGWQVTDTTAQTSYSGNINIQSEENVGSIRGVQIIRTVQSVIPISIIFKNTLLIYTNIMLDSMFSLYAAILSKIYIPGSPSTGIFNILTSLQYPYALNTSAPMIFLSYPVGLTPTITDISQPSECPANSTCTQMFALSLSATSACTFTGTYSIQFTVMCNPSITNSSDCPVNSTNNYANIVLTMDSENFCVTTVYNIMLTGSIQSYSDPSYSIVQNAFTYGETAYFQVQTASPQVFLTGCSILRIQWDQNGNTQLLYTNSNITSEGITEGLVIGTNTTDSAEFQFNLDPRWMPLPVDGSLSYNVSVIVQVSYTTFNGQSDRKNFEVLMNQQTSQNQGSQLSNQQKSIMVAKGSSKLSQSSSFSLNLVFLLLFLSLII